MMLKINTFLFLNMQTCTACLTSSDCTTSVNNICLPGVPPQKNTCVQCVDDTSCDPSGSNPVCQTSTHKCVQCLTNDQCAAPNGVCRPDNTCGPECTQDSQCTVPPKTTCNLSTDTCVECITNDQCQGSSNYCNTATGGCTQCADGQTWDQGRQVCTSCTPIGGCASLTCPGGVSTCTSCDTSLNYQASPVDGKCECQTGFRDLNDDPSDGCEYEQTCTIGDGNPVFYQDCNFGTSTWQPFCLTEGTYDVSTRAADMSSMQIGSGFRVSFKYGSGGLQTCNAYSSTGTTNTISCFVSTPCYPPGSSFSTTRNLNDRVVQVTVSRYP